MPPVTRPSASATDDADRPSTRERLLDAAVAAVRAKGLHATSVEELCAAAGVTKGGFFHHFASKDALAAAAAEHWTATTGVLFATADYHRHADPVDRVLGYVDLRAALLTGAPSDYSCLAGTMVQEAYANDAVREACAASILGHAATLEDDLDAALASSPHRARVTARSLARYTQVVLQGAFVVAKAAGDVEVARDAVSHLRGYLDLLLRPPEQSLDGPSAELEPSDQTDTTDTTTRHRKATPRR